MIKKVKTNEGIQYQKLSQEEMKSRGILGRLIGPCADFINPTRNGRKYSEKLWENVFENPIMKEKIKNGVCFGELGHPAERTEVDMEKIAVCLREQPVKNDQGQLLAVFDILDTPNGRILKTLCDYGSTVGVSSRGQGDLFTDMNGDEAVDPDTYECECFDVVLVPAVEAARMQYVKEDLDTNKFKMKKALTESLNNATEEDKRIMEKTLEELNIKLDENTVINESSEEQEVKVVRTVEIPCAGGFEDDSLNEFDSIKVYSRRPDEDNMEYVVLEGPKDDLEEFIAHEFLADEGQGYKDFKFFEELKEELTEDAEEVEETEEAPEETAEEEISTEEPVEEKEPIDVLKDKIDVHGEEDTIVIAEKGQLDNPDAPKIEVEVTEEEKEILEPEFHEEEKVETEDKVEAAVEEKVGEVNEIPQPEEEPEVEAEETIALAVGEPAPIEEECNGESCADIKEDAKEVVEESASAINDGDVALIKNLQEALKCKSDLEGSVKSLQEKLAVSDTKVNELTEENNNYKKSIARLATMSKSNKDLKESVTKLEESLKEKDAVITEQKERIARLVKSRKESVSESASLTESIETKKSEITTLTEDLNKSKDEVKTLTEKLSNSDKEISELNESLTKESTLKEAYKKLANKAVNKYIDIKATTLGLTSNDIKRKLGESYTLDDVDKVCEDLKAYQLNVSKLPFSIDRKVSVRVNEAVSKINKESNQFDDDEVDEGLIKLAGF